MDKHEKMNAFILHKTKLNSLLLINYSNIDLIRDFLPKQYENANSANIEKSRPILKKSANIEKVSQYWSHVSNESWSEKTNMAASFCE